MKPPREWLEQYERLREQESVQAYREWQTATFRNGCSIPGNRVEEVNRDLLYRLFIPVFRRNCLPRPKGNGTCLVSSPKDDWWEGLNAFSRIFGSALAYKCVATFGANGSVSLDGWRKSHRINSRAIIGKTPVSYSIEAEWSEDAAFLKGLHEAVESTGNRHLRAMYFLARGWDTSRIPVRYFTDEAALAWLNEAMQLPDNQRFSLDVYRADIRGKRKGLDLDATAHRPQIVKGWGPSIVTIKQSAADRHGVDLSTIDAAPFGGVFDALDWSTKKFHFV
jgi:hypothetical protein